MYILKDQMVVEQKTEVRGGIGTLSFKNIVPGDALYKAGTMLAEITIPAGCSVGAHDHTENFEWYYIIQGEAKVTDGSEEKILTAGDAEICGEGNTHSVTNVGTTDVKLLAGIFWNPAKHEYK
ncbi:MAG: cupin domain-containing protein [Clostridia bacterium]|nr:cupin domain-containing protein [Clostridia bacterium]